VDHVLRINERLAQGRAYEPIRARDEYTLSHIGMPLSLAQRDSESIILTEPAASDTRATLSLGVSIVLYRTPVAVIGGLLEQLLEQGARRIYLIDNSPPEFDAFAGWRPSERVIAIRTRRNLGYGRANNLAIGDSVRRHDYHLVCNPDVELGPGTLAGLCALLGTRLDIGLCGPRVVGSDGRQHYLCKRLPTVFDLAIRRFAPGSWFQKHRAHYEMRDCSYDEPMEPPFISGCFMFFRSSVLSRLDGFDERYFLYLEDLDLSRRAAVIARNYYAPHLRIVHGHARGAYKSLRLFKYFTVSLIRYFNKWGWLEKH
jgi:GT2 family glycosyltransferase